MTELSLFLVIVVNALFLAGIILIIFLFYRLISSYIKRRIQHMKDIHDLLAERKSKLQMTRFFLFTILFFFIFLHWFAILIEHNQVSNKGSPLSNTNTTRHYEDTCYSHRDHHQGQIFLKRFVPFLFFLAPVFMPASDTICIFGALP